MTEQPGILERQIRFYTAQCDPFGSARLSAVLEAMQDAAADHFDALHAGHEALSGAGLAWVLFKLDAQIDRYPRHREQVTVRTFTKQSRFKFYPRYYVMYDERENRLAAAGALWMLMDLHSRRTVLPKDSGILLPDAPLDPPIKISATAKQLTGEGQTEAYRPTYSDLDFNGHVHNLRYADWLCNRLGTKILKEKEVSFLSMDYSYEVAPDMILQNTLVLQEDAFRFSGTAEGKQLFGIYGTLRRRGA